MKEFLLNLLIEQYKQESLFEELKNRGIDFTDLCINNRDIIERIVGFPPDNSRDYDYTYLNTNGELREEGKKIPDDDMFCSDWLYDKYYEISRELFQQQKIVATNNGLRIDKGAGPDVVAEKLLGYIDWLYEEYDEYKRNK